MAHGYLQKKLKLKAQIYSAGIETHGLNSYAVLVMQMDNINISNNTSNLIEEYININFDFIITVCDHANESCPYIPSDSAIRIHKNFEDPSKILIDNEEKKIKKYIICRNEINIFCQNFIDNFFKSNY